ncbi:MAG TPA: HPr family phosphocarrier protein [Chloroflexi bacterium]|nr:HPr family phosphocarrier protein [Chloroflexota bacterium]
MPQVEVTVQHEVGLHARPAALFVKLASSFPCDITIANKTTDGQPVNAKSILSVLTLGVNKGHTIVIEAEGEQADEAVAALKELVESNFGE